MSSTILRPPTRLRDSSAAEIRADLLVHALAQLPNDVSGAVGAEGAERDHLTLLARAYGVEDRVIFESGAAGPPYGRLVRLGAKKAPDVRGATTMAELIEAASGPGDLGAPLRHDDDRFAGERIAIVTNIPAPYRIPLFNEIHRRLAAAGSDFRVFFLAERARARAWMRSGIRITFEHEFVSSVELPLRKRGPLVPVALETRLAAFGPTVLLAAGFSPFVSGRAARYAERRGVLFGLWSGEISTTATAKSRLRQRQRARLAAQCDFGIVYGFHAGEYLRRLRPDLPFVYGRNTSPTSEFPRRRPAQPSRVELVAVGDLTSPRKGIDVLVDALRLVPTLPCRLTVVGGGRLLPALEERARGDRRIEFVGSMAPERVHGLYERADAFLFPSREDIFGLALVEAMGFGLAVVSSRNPGAVGDVAVDGRNSLLIEGDRPEAWAAAIERIVLDHDLRRSLGEAASTTIRRRWTIEHAAAATIAGLRLGLLVRARRERAPSPGVDTPSRGGGNARMAHATRRSRSWLIPDALSPAEPVVDSQDDVAAFRPRVAASKAGRDLVLVSLTLLVVIRLFTEVLNIVPRAANFIDVPLVLLLATAASLRPVPNRLGNSSPFFVFGVLFLATVAVATIANPSRVQFGPVLMFVYGFLAPLAVYWAAYRLWPPGHARSFSRLLVALGTLQFVVVFGFDLPQFLASHNPDDIAGTFGTNAYQLVFFLLLLASLLAASFTFEHTRLTARLAPVFFVLIATTTFLAQYRALLVTTALTLIVLGLYLVPVSWRGILATALATGAFAGSLWFVASQFPVTKFDPLVATLQDEPLYLAKTRMRIARSVSRLYTDNPRFMVSGTGPGTFSSRAWRTFAVINTASRSDVAGPYVLALTRGALYRTDVSEKHVVPRLRAAEAVQGSRAVNAPLSSYLSLLAEVGLFGALLLVAIYLVALSRAARMTLRAIKSRTPQDPLPALALASTVAFCVLLQMAALENWLEVTRVTFITWILFAVVTKEFEARRSE